MDAEVWRALDEARADAALLRVLLEQREAQLLRREAQLQEAREAAAWGLQCEAEDGPLGLRSALELILDLPPGGCPADRA